MESSIQLVGPNSKFRTPAVFAIVTIFCCSRLRRFIRFQMTDSDVTRASISSTGSALQTGREDEQIHLDIPTRIETPSMESPEYLEDIYESRLCIRLISVSSTRAVYGYISSLKRSSGLQILQESRIRHEHQ